MKYLQQQITDFTSTNLTEVHLPWSAAISYAVDAIVLVGTELYTSIVAANQGNEPILEANLDIKWFKSGVSNKFSMLDLASNTKAVFTGSMFVEFTQGTMRTLAIGNYGADSITVEVRTAGIVTYTYTTASSTNLYVYDWWSYLYTPYGYAVNRAIKIELPTIGDTVRIIFNKSAESTETSCGFLVGGSAIEMGESLFGVGFKFNSFATKEFDTFGTLKITKRSVQDLVDFTTEISSYDLTRVKRNIKEIYNDIVCFIVDDSDNETYENIITFGIIQDASIILNGPVLSTVAWSILEVI